MSQQKITDDFKTIIENGTIKEKTFTMQTAPRLERKQYTDFMKIAEVLGLKWSRKEKCHLYEGEGNLQDALNEVLELGYVVDLKKLYQQYYTPPELAKRAVELAEIEKDEDTLEPSAGQGAILEEILKKETYKFAYCEIDEKNRDILWDKFGKQVYAYDFMGVKGEFDKIVMNPPFAKSQDVKHILHAYSLLTKRGRVVSIASSSIQHRQGKLYDELRKLNPEYIEIEKGAFKDSGTLVNSCFVIINK